MYTIPNFLSFLFFIAFISYMSMALYLLFIDNAKVTSRIFAHAIFSMAIWSFGYSYSINAPNIERALLFRRIAAFGWCLLFPCFLHTIILYINKRSVAFKTWLDTILYLPAFISVFLFSFSNFHTTRFYNFKYTKFGWQNFGNHIPETIFGYSGIILYLMFILSITFAWMKSAEYEREKYQAKYMLYAFTITMILGASTDIISALILHRVFPEISAIISILPCIVMFRSIIKYKINPTSQSNIATEVVNHMHEGLIYVDEFYNISHMNKFAYDILKYPMGKFNTMKFTELFDEPDDYGDIYFPKTNLTSRNNNDSYLVFSKHIEKKLYCADDTELDVNISFAPIYNELGDYRYGCIIFTNISEIIYRQQTLKDIRKTLQATVAYRTTELENTNIQLLEEIIQREYIDKWNSILLEVSSSFINVTIETFQHSLSKSLQLIGEFFDVDRCIIFRLTNDYKYLTLDSLWIRDGVEAIAIDDNIPTLNYNWTFDNINRGVLLLSDINELPREAFSEKNILAQQSVETCIILPLISKVKGQLFGLLRLDSVKRNKNWDDASIRMLLLYSNLIVEAISKTISQKLVLELAYQDSLTLLPNKRKFIDTLDYIISNKEYNKKFGVLLFDLDSFKNVNDSLGHDAGDELIKMIANDLCTLTKNYEYVSRYGGDEFILIIENIEYEDDLMRKINLVSELFNRTYSIKSQEFFITASIGGSIYPTDGNTANELIKNAEIAMYKAKKLGKTRTVIFSDALKNEIYLKAKLTGDLTKALEKNELFLMYQPQVDLKTKQVSGVEALLRWNHSELGVIMPNVFIPLAEETSLIIPIGNWVLANAIKQAKEWQNLGYRPITISVNLSLSQFISEKFVSNIKSICLSNRFDPKYLELEITESIAMGKNSSIISALSEFKAMGIKIAMDDFGTQYSSLASIKELPIDTLKIALEFVQNLEYDTKNREITNIIIAIAKNLNFKLVAEGVETDFQIKYMEENSVDIIQGYYYYKPMLAKDIVKTL